MSSIFQMYNLTRFIRFSESPAQELVVRGRWKELQPGKLEGIYE